MSSAQITWLFEVNANMPGRCAGEAACTCQPIIVCSAISHASNVTPGWLWQLGWFEAAVGTEPASDMLPNGLAMRAGADDFLPVLIWVVIKAQPTQLASNLEYIQRFRMASRCRSRAVRTCLDPGLVIARMLAAHEGMPHTSPLLCILWHAGRLI